MQFHHDKCKVVRLTNKCTEYDLPFYEFRYSLNGVILEYVTSEKDLGVHIHIKLSWKIQCDTLISKANNQLGLVRRSCYFIHEVRQRRALYLTLVRSIFEHCCQVWAPQEKTSLHEFDLLQKRAVKWICKESHASYSDELFLQKQRDLDILPMKYKFIFSDIILFYNIINNNVQIKLPNYVERIEPQEVHSVTRSNINISKGIDHLQYRCKILPKLNAFKNTFFVRTLKNWNDLPLSVREIENFDKFSIALKDHLWRILGCEPD